MAADAGALDQEAQSVGEELRLHDAGFLAERGEAPALRRLELLEDAARRMADLRQFDGGMRHVAGVPVGGDAIGHAPDEALQLRLGDNDSRLEEITREGVEKVAPAQFDHKVRGTAVTYEDLALKFLYWPNARVTGENSISLRNCWKLELKAPNRQSQYSNVWLWVDKEGGALMKLEGYDWNGKLAKRFTVVSGQKIEGRWFLKEMRIEEFDPNTGKPRARTYLEIKK